MTLKRKNKEVKIGRWVDSASANPEEYLRRQIAEIVLTAIAETPELKDSLFLKGGALMSLVFESPRATRDIDFTTTEKPNGFPEFLKLKLDNALKISANKLGYTSHLSQVQSWEMKPPLERSTWPTLRVKIGYATKNSPEEHRLMAGASTKVLRLDISFNEPILSQDDLILDNVKLSIQTYSRNELIAEKLRALIQQPVRNRYRGQDVFDIARLIRTSPPSDEDRRIIHKMLLTKSNARNLSINRSTIQDESIYTLAKQRYESLKLEVDSEELDFERDLKEVRNFFISLPWKQNN